MNGLIVLLLVDCLMTVGWFGEYASGIPFSGADYGVFAAFSVVGILMCLALVIVSARELFGWQPQRS